MLADDLKQRQLMIEEDMYADAQNRLTKDNLKTVSRKAWSESKLGRHFTRSAATPFAKAVHAFVNQPAQFGRRMNSAAELLRRTHIESETLAYLFTKGVFNAMPLAHRRRVKRVSLCIRAADLIHDEWRIRHFANEQTRRNLLKKLFKTFDKRTYPRDWRRRTIKNYFYAEQMEWSAWTQRDKLAVGYALLVLFRDSTGLVETNKDSIFVDPSQALIDEFEAVVMQRPLDFMIYKPMVIPPLPWTTEHLFRGGYLSTRLTRRYSIIKGSRRRDVQRMVSMDWSKILPAVNAIQETPWRINTKMLDVLEWTMVDRGGNAAGLPPIDALPLPPIPHNYHTNDVVKKDHNRLCFLIRSENRENISKRLAVLSTMAVAKQYKNFKAIYFPHNLDSRGRAYPLPAFLNPQGPDYCKALLEFSRGKRIETDEHAAWLAIAGANAYGNDKIGLQERVDWIQDNDEMIFSISRDPKSDLRWMEASEPFQFLRFCFEWAGFWHTGFGYVSHMVVPVDATCSGLQHYSAMLRDEVGGRSVNLVPNLPRQDIYQDVADGVIEALFADASDKAKGWVKFGIDRKITKRQVMVVPYAGTFASCIEYTRAAADDKIKEGHVCPWNTADEDDHRDRLVFLAKHIWSAIDNTVVKAKEAMRWLTDVARLYTKHANTLEAAAYDKRMSWVTPDGFEAIHIRMDEKRKRLDTFLDGRVQLVYYEESDKLNASDMALAIAPNFVHSLDACLLRMSVVSGLQADIKDYAMVHDSFGVHASEMAVFLKQCVKPSFVQMYSSDVLKSFADRLPQELVLPALPEKGTLDLSGVLDSEFFFS